jgi:hypothetical protein
MHTFIQTCTRTHTHTHIHTYTHAYIHTLITSTTHACIHSNMHTHTYIHIYIHTHTHIHPYPYNVHGTCIHSYIHAHAHIHTYTHTYIHTLITSSTHAYIHTEMAHTHTCTCTYMRAPWRICIHRSMLACIHPSIDTRWRTHTRACIPTYTPMRHGHIHTRTMHTHACMRAYIMRHIKCMHKHMHIWMPRIRVIRAMDTMVMYVCVRACIMSACVYVCMCAWMYVCAHRVVLCLCACRACVGHVVKAWWPTSTF